MPYEISTNIHVGELKADALMQSYNHIAIHRNKEHETLKHVNTSS